MVKLLRAEAKEIGVILTYGVGVGLLSLAVPVGVQTLVNTVTFGSLSQPLLFLVIAVFLGLGIAAILRTVQILIVEKLQVRFFAYIALELAARLPSDFELPDLIPTPLLPSIEIESDFSRALKQRPELVRLGASRLQNEAEGIWADNQLDPKLDLQVSGSRDIGDGSVTRRGTQMEATLLLEIPLETRLNGGKRASAIATRDRIEANERLMKDRIIAEVRDAHSAIHAAFQRARLAIDETALAKKLEKGERARFVHGDSNVLFVNLREQATADAEVREVDALVEFQKGLAQFKAALGDL